MVIQVIGMGFVGLATALLLVRKSLTVYGYDINKKIIKSINDNSYWYKDKIFSEELKKALTNNSLKVSNKIVGGDVYIIAVQTGIKDQNKPDMSSVNEAIFSIIPILKKNDLIIFESTLSFGYLNSISNTLFAIRKDLFGLINIVYCPERLSIGDSLDEISGNDRVLAGLSIQCTQKGLLFYESFIEGYIQTANYDVVEISKLTENSLRDLQIAFANQLSMICDRSKVNVWDVIKCVNSHPSLQMLKPSIGVGGNCIPINPYFLIDAFPQDVELLKIARFINDKKTEHSQNLISEQIIKYYKLNSSRPIVAFMGLSYKPNVCDVKNSAALTIINQIAELDICEMILVDPYVDEYLDIPLWQEADAIEKADIIIYLIAHDAFGLKHIPDNKIVLDFVGVFQRNVVKSKSDVISSNVLRK